LSESPPILTKGLEEGGSKKENETIEDRPSFLWSTVDQFPVRSGDCEDRKDLEIFLDIGGYPIDEQGAVEGRSNLHHLFEAS